MMNSVFRFLMLGAIAATFTIVSFAQDPCANIEDQQAVYKKFTDNYQVNTLEGQQAALDAAKDYVQKYGSCPDTKQQIDYFKPYIPTQQKHVDDMKGVIAKNALYKRFNDAQVNKNWDEFYAAGKEIIAQDPDSEIAFDITIALGTVGLDQAASGNTKYNADTIKYAQDAINKINAGKTSKNFGVPGKTPDINFSYKIANPDKTTKMPETKNSTLGWLNYNIAFLKYYSDKSDAAKKEAIPYFYKVTQIDSVKKNKPEVYDAIGKAYDLELSKLEKDRQDKLAAANPGETDKKKWKDTDETKQIFALEKGYADRALDAYSRLYNILGASAATDPKSKTAQAGVYGDLKAIYDFRFQGKQNALDALIASTKTKPLIDPSTPVTPVVDVEATPATTTTGTTATPNGTMTTAPATTPSTTKPATTTTTTKPATTTTTTKPATTTTTTTPVKPTTATKPAPKKTNPKR